MKKQNKLIGGIVESNKSILEKGFTGHKNILSSWI